VVTIHVINALSADSPTPSEYASLRSRIVKALLRCIPDDMVATEEDVVADIERFLREADAGGWLQMEWYVNLESQARGNEVDEQGDESEKNGRGGDGDVSGVTAQRRAFGGMMTPQTDYLSEENVLGYREWREYVEGLMQ
jgi:origin recognition complex subunit 6